MKVKIKVSKEIDVRFLGIDAGVRYWEDAEVNGEDDIDFMETGGEGTPKIPFATKVKYKPEKHICSDHYRWKPVIDVEKGCIVGWPKGTTAKVHYKICEDGAYSLLDADYKKILEVNSYVPDCIGDMGDYIVMNIDEEGKIEDFSFSEEDVKEIIESDFDYEDD